MNKWKDTSNIKRIGDAFKPCLHPEHKVPDNMYLEPGEYEHTCPGCGKVTRLTIPYIY